MPDMPDNPTPHPNARLLARLHSMVNNMLDEAESFQLGLSELSHMFFDVTNTTHPGDPDLPKVPELDIDTFDAFGRRDAEQALDVIDKALRDFCRTITLYSGNLADARAPRPRPGPKPFWWCPRCRHPVAPEDLRHVENRHNLCRRPCEWIDAAPTGTDPAPDCSERGHLRSVN